MVIIEKSYMAKLKQLRDMKKNVAINHRWSTEYMLDQWMKLKAYRKSILVEKVSWEEERSLLMARF
jgi:hypothetical protein